MGITVTGFGRASGTPDVIELELGVSVLADGVEEARGTAAEKTQAIRRELMSAGVTEADLATSRYTIQTEHDYSGQGERLLGYRVTNVVRARLRFRVRLLAGGRLLTFGRRRLPAFRRLKQHRHLTFSRPGGNGRLTLQNLQYAAETVRFGAARI